MNLHDEIALTAYGLWERGGKEHGKDYDDWHQAEDMVKARHQQPQEGSGMSSGKCSGAEKAVPRKNSRSAPKRNSKAR